MSELKVGEKGKIISIKGGVGSLKRRLLDMGMTPESVVVVEKITPLGDPIDILIKNYHLSLRKKEVSEIIVGMI